MKLNTNTEGNLICPICEGINFISDIKAKVSCTFTDYNEGCIDINIESTDIENSILENITCNTCGYVIAFNEEELNNKYIDNWRNKNEKYSKNYRHN